MVVILIGLHSCLGFHREQFWKVFNRKHLFSDDCVCYCEIKDNGITAKLQKDIDILGRWARNWGMRFQPVKSNMVQLMRK